MPEDASSPLLAAIMNLSRFHREHEKYYASKIRMNAENAVHACLV